MKTKQLLQTAAFGLALSFILYPSAFLAAAPLGTEFNYQGKLAEGGNPAAGSYDLKFTLYDAQTGLAVVGGPITNAAVAVSNGLFGVTLDFGPTAFNGDARWLEIGVRSNGLAADFTVLSPRTEINATPYASYAPKAKETEVAKAVVDGAITAAKIADKAIKAEHLAPGAVTSAAIADGAVTEPKLSTAYVAKAGDTMTGALNLPANGLSAGGNQLVLLGGNVGIGTATPATPLDVNGEGRMWSLNQPNVWGSVAMNAAWDGGSFTWRRLVDGHASLMQQSGSDGGLNWGVADTSSAGSPITWRNPLQLTRDGDVVIDWVGANTNGTLSGGLRFGWSGSGEGIASKRSDGGNQWGLDLYTANQPRLSIANNGNVGVGTTNPTVKLDVAGALRANAIDSPGGQPLELRANGQTALRLQQAGDSPNVIGGWSGNYVGSNAVGATIAGGGRPRVPPLLGTSPNAVTADYGSVLGGRGNTVNGYVGTVAGGEFNAVNGYAGTVAGGEMNVASGSYSFAAGYQAIALHDGSFVWGDSTGAGLSSTSSNQFIIRASGGVGIGTNNPQSALHVAGVVTAHTFAGSGASLTGLNGGALAPGSIGTAALAANAVTGAKIADGTIVASDVAPNTFWAMNGNAGTTPGPQFLGTADNQPLELKVNNQRALRLQPANHSPNLLGGYNGNSIGPNVVGATIAGGGCPQILPSPFAYPNTVNADFGSVLGGRGNSVSGYAATVAGGQNNQADGNYSFAAGYDATATHAGSFVWSDSSGGASSSANDQFVVQAAGGVKLVNNTELSWGSGNNSRLSSDQGGSIELGDSVNGGLPYIDFHLKVSQPEDYNVRLMNTGIGYLTCYGNFIADTLQGQTVTITSDRAAKQDFAPVDAREILDRVASVPVQTWAFTNQPGTRHIGPVAQDFYAAFGVGADDKHIATVDADGAALAAIQGLYQIVKEKDSEITELKKRLLAVESALSARPSQAGDNR